MPENSEANTALDKMIEVSSNPQALRYALALLFPRAARHLDVITTADFRRTLRMFRLHNPDASTTYFGLSPSSAIWNKTTIADLSIASPNVWLLSVVNRLPSLPPKSKYRQARIILDSLSDLFEQSTQISKDWIISLSNSAPVFASIDHEYGPNFLDLTNLSRLRLAVLSGLRKIDKDQRSEMLTAATAEVQDFTLLCDVSRSLLGDLRPEGAPSERDRGLSLEGDGDQLRDALLAATRRLASTGEIWGQAEPKDILWFWWGSTRDEEVRAFANGVLHDPLQLTELANALTGTSVSSDRGVQDFVDERSANLLVDLAKVQQAIASLDLTVLPDAHRAKAARFVAALDRKSFMD